MSSGLVSSTLNFCLIKNSALVLFPFICHWSPRSWTEREWTSHSPEVATLPLVWSLSLPGNTICKFRSRLPPFLLDIYIGLLVFVHPTADLEASIDFRPLSFCILYKLRDSSGFLFFIINFSSGIY